MPAGSLVSGLAIVLLAIVFGFAGMSLVFTDLAENETVVERAVITASFYFFSAAVIGYLSPRIWIVGLLTAWSGLILGYPLAAALLGAYAGSLLKRKRYVSRLLERIFSAR